MNCFNNLDGEVSGLVEYDSQLASSPVKGNPFDEDTFYPMNGEAYGDDLAGEEGGPFDYAIGDGIRRELRRRRIRREKRQDLRQRRRTTRTLSKADARKAQLVAAKGLSKESKADVELAKALAATPTETKAGLSTGAKIGIGVGIVAVLGIVGFLLYKRGKGGK